MGARYANMIVGALLMVAPVVGGCAGHSGGSATSDAMQGPAALPAAARGDVRPLPSDYRSIAEIPDVHFDFDRYDIRPDAARMLEKSAAWLRANPSSLLLIEGHADERGTNEYNMALGDRRARASMNYLVALGVAATRVTTISYGEERGACFEHTEKCWAKNRRAHFGVKAQ